MASDANDKLVDKLWEVKGEYREVPVETLRQAMEQVAFPVADDVDVEVTEAAGCPAEWVRAPAVDRDRAVLYLHGGGFVMGSLGTHRKLAGDLSRASGVSVLLLDYPLAPEHPFPAGIESAVAAFGALAAELGPANVVVGGDSAGGGLVMATLLRLRDQGDDLPAAGICLSPWVDLVETDHRNSPQAPLDPVVHTEGIVRMRDLYLGGADPAQPLASPARADLSGLPPLLIQVGQAEVLLGDSQRLAARAEECGVDVTFEEWPEMVHVWQMFAGRVPEATEAVEGIGRFVAGRVGPAAA
jgi:acetyl esterase/lipase